MNSVIRDGIKKQAQIHERSLILSKSKFSAVEIETNSNLNFDFVLELGAILMIKNDQNSFSRKTIHRFLFLTTRKICDFIGQRTDLRSHRKEVAFFVTIMNDIDTTAFYSINGQLRYPI